ncbi:target of Nesh-SH3-like isoform X2 [Brienomyrus brachyistius]|uniref:target of Nesh-SH3-like isoform X2 n=1 Tax=Brienomyrus brachyistius TaxID=42636 RepID=UPI0020B340E5|nr:target of Nesh-SH3-like isoform X2 [Brienomyrus brachyistius]
MMILRITVLLLVGIVFISYSLSQRIRESKQNLRVRINVTEDTIVLRFIHPKPDVKLEGYVLGFGSNMFSKHYIQLPENGELYEAEMDAEPKYLVAVQPAPPYDVKKQCTGQVDLERPLHLVIGTVTPTSVLLSWGAILHTPFQGNIMDDCLDDGHYTVRYRERNKKWNYQMCPTTDTVVDNLEPNTPYEFGVRANKEDESGQWSKPVVHSTDMTEKSMQDPYMPRTPNGNPVKPNLSGSQALFPPRPAIHNRNQTRLPPLLKNPRFPGGPRTSLGPALFSAVAPGDRPGISPIPRSIPPQGPQLPLGSANNVINVSSPSKDIPPALPQLLSIKPLPTSATLLPYRPSKNGKSQGRIPPKFPYTSKTHSPLVAGQSRKGFSQPEPAAVAVDSKYGGKTIPRNTTSTAAQVPSAAILQSNRSSVFRGRGVPLPAPNGRRQLAPPRATNASQAMMKPGVNGERHRGNWYPKHRLQNGSPVQHPKMPYKRKLDLAGKPGTKDNANDIKKPNLKPNPKPKSTPLPKKPITEKKPSIATPPAIDGSREDIWDNSSVFTSLPAKDVDAMGKKRYVAPHVKYWPGKKPEEPCSITNSLNYFPEEYGMEQNVTGPPRLPPSNLTVLTVEGCPSFVILDWEKTDNETTEYEVISTTEGPAGKEVSILTTNKTHTAVENLKPESSYEFTVKPKNELGSGPPTEPVSFNTESADPLTGKTAIWTEYSFRPDIYSECNGKQYVKRTWYRKFVGIQLCNSLRYKIYLGDTLSGKFYNIGDQTGHGEDHCQFVDSYLDGRTGSHLYADQLPVRSGFFRAMRQQPVSFGTIGGNSRIPYVAWYECGIPIPGKW